MNIKKWFSSKNYKTKGGIIGVITCILLFIFYFTIYIKILSTLFLDGMIPNSTLLLPTITGHLFLPFVVYAFDTAPIFVQIIVGVTYIMLLTGIYFLVGFIIGWLVQKNKKNNMENTP